MGINETPDELGHKSPLNGHDTIYSTATWRDNVVNKKPDGLIKRKSVIFLSIDVVALVFVLGILRNLNTSKEILAMIVAVWYLAARAVIIIVKLFAFIGKNKDWIKRGVRALKDIIKD